MDVTDFNTGSKGQRTKRKKKQELETIVYGKVPPQAIELEEAVLGAIMLDGPGGVNVPAFDQVTPILSPDCFYKDAHQRIYKAMQRLSQKSQPMDVLTVVEELRKTEELDMVGGPYVVNKLTNSVVSSAHIEAHARIIFERYVKREIIRAGGFMLQEGYEDSGDAFELLDEVEKRVLEIGNVLNRKATEPIDAALVRSFKEIYYRAEKVREGGHFLTGVPSGFKDMDKVTHGWQAEDLIILAARPAVGKTALALNLARNAARDNYKPTPVAFFSLEMSTNQLVQRLISSETGIDLSKIMKGNLEEHELKDIYQKGVQPLSEAKIFIDDTAALTIFELRAKARRLKSMYDIGLIIIDYLQLMGGVKDARENREQEISNISRNLKALAKELHIPIIALSQLSREVERRGENKKIPQLSDLRDSGAIEQDADVVMFIYRPEYYDIHANERGQPNNGETHIKFAKHRNGTLETVKLRALLYIQKFVAFEEAPPKSPTAKGGGLIFPEIVFPTGNPQVGEHNEEDPF